MREELERKFRNMGVAETSFGRNFSEIMHKVTVALREITADIIVNTPVLKPEMQ